MNFIKSKTISSICFIMILSGCSGVNGTILHDAKCPDEAKPSKSIDVDAVVSNLYDGLSSVMTNKKDNFTLSIPAIAESFMVYWCLFQGGNFDWSSPESFATYYNYAKTSSSLGRSDMISNLYLVGDETKDECNDSGLADLANNYVSSFAVSSKNAKEYISNYYSKYLDSDDIFSYQMKDGCYLDTVHTYTQQNYMWSNSDYNPQDTTMNFNSDEGIISKVNAVTYKRANVPYYINKEGHYTDYFLYFFGNFIVPLDGYKLDDINVEDVLSDGHDFDLSGDFSITIPCFDVKNTNCLSEILGSSLNGETNDYEASSLGVKVTNLVTGYMSLGKYGLNCQTEATGFRDEPCPVGNTCTELSFDHPFFSIVNGSLITRIASF